MIQKWWNKVGIDGSTTKHTNKNSRCTTILSHSWPPENSFLVTVVQGETWYIMNETLIYIQFVT